MRTEDKGGVQVSTSAYAAGLEGRLLWLPDLLDASLFKGDQVQAKIRETNYATLLRLNDHQRGLIAYLRNHGVSSIEAETIANNAGIQGFNSALNGQPRPVEIHVDSERMIGEKAQKGARETNSASWFRQQGWKVGSRIARNKQKLATAGVI